MGGRRSKLRFVICHLCEIIGRSERFATLLQGERPDREGSDCPFHWNGTLPHPGWLRWL